jgi:hypothetical protein
MSWASHPLSSQTWEINQRRKPQKGQTTGLLPQYALMLDKSCTQDSVQAPGAAAARASAGLQQCKNRTIVHLHMICLKKK